ncbi:ROK family protein [Colwelliaceae bacterium 6441]
MNSSSIVTLDIGGTTINAGRYQNGNIEVSQLFNFSAQENEAEILQFIIDCIDQVKKENTVGIAIGVPSIVDIKLGIVFDAVNIPAWKKYQLKEALFAHYGCDIYINNDVNCFVAGESAFGAGKTFEDVVGVCLGTGFGSGFFINNQLFAGHNCCAGEVGGISYLDATIDDYCSGQFFLRHYQTSGAALSTQAKNGDKAAILAFETFGQHLAKAISHILFVIDPQIIVIGGSVAKSYHLFIDALWQELENFPYQVVIKNLNIVPSELENSALLGAAHLYLQQKK